MFSLLKLLGKAIIILSLAGAAGGIISASGCGSYVPHKPDGPVIDLPDEPDEPDEPSEPDEPVEHDNYVNTTLFIADGDAISMWMTMSLFDYKGEISDVHVQCNYYSVPDPDTNKSNKAVVNIGTGGAPVLKAGKSYELTIRDNDYTIPFGTKLKLSELTAGYYNIVKTIDFKAGTVTIKPQVDIWYLIADLFPSGANSDGVIDFYITITEN